MRKKLLKILPWVTVTAGVATVVFLIILNLLHTKQGEENLIIRQEVINILKRLQVMHPAKIDAPEFTTEVAALIPSPGIATVWLINTDGKIIFSKGSTARSTGSQKMVSECATEETCAIMNSLPEEMLSDYQRIGLLAASAIQREGTHNDIYNHLLREIHSKDDSPVGFIGIAYEINPEVSDLWIASVLVAVFGFLLYWFSLPLWVFLDACQREKRPLLWALFVMIGNLGALIGYLLARSPVSNTVKN